MRKAEVKPVSQKQRILDAATNVFLATGFEKTSTAEIARVAKISKRELYLHFADKRALLAAVVEDLQVSMQGRMDETWAATASMEEVLLHSATKIQKFILSERFGKLVRIVAAESYHSPAIAEQFFEMGPNQGRKATARYLRAQMRQGRLRTARPAQGCGRLLDLVVGAQLMTAVILGQIDHATPTRTKARHAVEVFLMIYGAKSVKRSVKRPRARV